MTSASVIVDNRVIAVTSRPSERVTGVTSVTSIKVINIRHIKITGSTSITIVSLMNIAAPRWRRTSATTSYHLRKLGRIHT